MISSAAPGASKPREGRRGRVRDRAELRGGRWGRLGLGAAAEPVHHLTRELRSRLGRGRHRHQPGAALVDEEDVARALGQGRQRALGPDPGRHHHRRLDQGGLVDPVGDDPVGAAALLAVAANGADALHLAAEDHLGAGDVLVERRARAGRRRCRVRGSGCQGYAEQRHGGHRSGKDASSGPDHRDITSQPEYLGEHRGHPVVVVRWCQVVGRLEHRGVRVRDGVRRAGPGQHRQVVRHVSERDHVAGVDLS